MTQDMVCVGECSICTRKECAFSCQQVECCTDVHYIQFVKDIVQFYSLTYLLFLSIAERRVLKFPTVIPKKVNEGFTLDVTDERTGSFQM